MLIVDSQVHIWGANTRERPWPTAKNGLKPVPVHNNGVPFTRDFVLREMKAACVDRVIIVPPSWEGDRKPAVHLPRGRYNVHRGNSVAHG